MKKTAIVALGICAQLIGSVSFADQSIDNINGSITCTVGDDVSVTINKTRTKFIAVDGEGSKLIYTVVAKHAGDVSTTYIGKDQSKVRAILAFDDRGDVLSIGNGQALPLINCHNSALPL